MAPAYTLVGNTWERTALKLFDADGRLVVSTPEFEGGAVAAGADGAIYMFRCDDAATSTNRVLAYSRELKELWRLDLGGAGCKGMTGNVVLDDAGVLYLMRRGDGAGTAEVIAIQTASPGLADSSWPSTRHDNRGTAWLVPGVGVSDAVDGGSAVDAGPVLDAPGPWGD